MSVTSALTVTFAGSAQGAGKAIDPVTTGAEAFAGVIADLQAMVGPVPGGIEAVQPSAGIDISTSIAPAEAMARALPPGQALIVCAEATASLEEGTPQRISRTRRALKEEPAQVPVATLPGSAAPAQIAMVLPMAAAATAPAASPAVAGGKSSAATPVASRKPELAQASPEQPESVAMTPFLSEPPTKGAPAKTQSEIVLPAAFAQTDGGARSDDRSASQDGQARQTPAAPESRKGADSAPVSLTAVADIVRNLPPIAQSQLGAVVPADAVAVRAATDVGASLQGQVIDMGVGGQWIDRVAKEITALAQGSGHSRFQLSPPNLGRLQIDVWQGEGGGRVQLLTETDEAAQRLRQDQAGLQADARLSALSLDRIVIDRAPGAFGASQDQQSGTGRQHSDTADRGGSQNGNQAAAQNSGNGGAGAGQGKAPLRRDVFNERTQADAQDDRPSSHSDDRHVRYA